MTVANLASGSAASVPQAPTESSTAVPTKADEGKDKAAPVLGSGPSHGFFFEGTGSAGLGDRGHNGGGMHLGYTLGVPLNNGPTRLFLDPQLAFRLDTGSLPYMSLGGEKFFSDFTSFGASLGAALRVQLPVANNRIFLSAGVRGNIGYFSTPETTPVMTPPVCEMGMAGRNCEPAAMPRTGNAGNTGLLNPDGQFSRGTSGVSLGFNVPISVGVDVLRGSWGSGGLYASFNPGYNYLMPGDGHGFGYGTIAGSLGLYARFGGSAAEGAKNSINDPAVDKKIPPYAPGQGLTLDADAVRALAGLAPDDVILGVKLDDHPEGTPPYQIQGDWMTPGAHTIQVRYRHAGEAEGTEHVRPINIDVGATKVDENSTAPQNFGPFMVTPVFSKSSGVAEFQWKTGNDAASAPAIPANRGVLHRPPLVEGEAAKDVPVLTVGSALNAQFPANSQAVVRVIDVNGSVVGSAQTFNLDPTKANTITIPRSLPDGAYSVEVTFKTPTSSYQAIYARTLGPDTPPMATLTNVKQPILPNSGTSFGRDTMNIEFDTNLAGEHRVRVKVGNHTEDLTVTAGAITGDSKTRHIKLPLSGAPGSWADTGASGRRYSVGVTITPLDKDGKEGSAIPAGNVTILRARSGGGSGHRPAASTPAATTHRLPGAGAH